MRFADGTFTMRLYDIDVLESSQPHSLEGAGLWTVAGRGDRLSSSHGRIVRSSPRALAGGSLVEIGLWLEKHLVSLWLHGSSPAALTGVGGEHRDRKDKPSQCSPIKSNRLTRRIASALHHRLGRIDPKRPNFTIRPPVIRLHFHGRDF